MRWLAAAALAAAATAAIEGDLRESLHMKQKHLLGAQLDLVRAQAAYDQAARAYQEELEKARLAEKKGSNCTLTDALKWQCPEK
jgi:hypothetical protein